MCRAGSRQVIPAVVLCAAGACLSCTCGSSYPGSIYPLRTEFVSCPSPPCNGSWAGRGIVPPPLYRPQLGPFFACFVAFCSSLYSRALSALGIFIHPLHCATIGLEGVPNAGIGEANISTVQSGTNPWTTNFDPGMGAAGANIVIDDFIG